MWGYVRNRTNDGYGYAGLKIVQALQSLGVDVNWQDESAPVSFSFTQPQDYGGNINQYRIGYTPWESSKIPEFWVEPMNWRDEIWTTSHACKEWFSSCGVTKDIRVVPHGIDTNDWSLSRRTKDDPFIFLHMGEPADRKGGQQVFDAFMQEFAGNDDVFLVYKTTSWVEARWLDDTGSIIGPVDLHPRVEINSGTLDITDLDKLFSMVHCLVYPSQGEGFGMIPFQSAATGMPTIIPAWGGMKEFSDRCINVKYHVGPSQHGYHLGDWAFPDTNDIAAKMRWVYDNYDQASSQAYGNALVIRETSRWEDIFAPVVEDLSRLWS